MHRGPGVSLCFKNTRQIALGPLEGLIVTESPLYRPISKLSLILTCECAGPQVMSPAATLYFLSVRLTEVSKASIFSSRLYAFLPLSTRGHTLKVLFFFFPKTLAFIFNPFLPTWFLFKGLPRWLSDKESVINNLSKQETQVRSLDQEDPWRRKWLSTSAFLLQKSCGQRSLAGYSPWGCKESDTTEHSPTFFFK